MTNSNHHNSITETTTSLDIFHNIPCLRASCCGREAAKAVKYRQLSQLSGVDRGALGLSGDTSNFKQPPLLYYEAEPRWMGKFKQTAQKTTK